MTAKEAKDLLSRYIDRNLVSVRAKHSNRLFRDIKGKYHSSHRTSLEIKIRTDKTFNQFLGIEQAFAHREALSEWFNLTFYGYYDESGMNIIEPHSVKVTVK